MKKKKQKETEILTLEKKQEKEGIVSLQTISKDLHITYEAAYLRLRKFLMYIGADIKTFKTDDNKIVFFKSEKVIIIELLKEMGESYLVALTSKRPTGKSVEEIYQNTKEFLSRMNSIVKDIKDIELREEWKLTLQLITKVQAEELHIDVINKIKDIGIKFNVLKYEDLIEVYKDINEGLDYWVATHLEPKIKILTENNTTV